MAMEDQEFRRIAERELESLKHTLIAAESEADFEVEEQGGVIQVVFEDPPAKFVITTNSPVRQIWISALATSYKLDLAGERFVLSKSGEDLKQLVSRLINEQLGDDVVR